MGFWKFVGIWALVIAFFGLVALWATHVQNVKGH